MKAFLRKHRLLIISFSLLILSMLIISYFFYEPFLSLIEILKAKKALFLTNGIFGYLLFSIIVAIQVIFAFLPGEPIEICAGFIFGSINGLICCLLGMIIGSSIIYLIVRFFKHIILKNELILNYLNDSKNLSFTVFILFFIPGTPKDLITYIMPLTKMKLIEFLTISSIARIPSIISSTLAGSSLQTGNINITIIIFIITGVISLLGLYFYNNKVNS